MQMMFTICTHVLCERKQQRYGIVYLTMAEQEEATSGEVKALVKKHETGKFWNAAELINQGTQCNHDDINVIQANTPT